jgi:hypothetical protein
MTRVVESKGNERNSNLILSVPRHGHGRAWTAVGARDVELNFRWGGKLTCLGMTYELGTVPLSLHGI